MKNKNLLAFFFCVGFLPAFSQLAQPVKVDGSKYAFTAHNIYFEVDTALGGRISSLKIDNSEYMYVNWSNSLVAGSTFWPSPQSKWGWPPPATLDEKVYSVKIENNKLITKSGNDTKTSLMFYKIFSVDSADTSVSIQYIIKNQKTTSQKWAPWEVTRVPHEGLTFFAKGDGTVTGNMASKTTESNACVWYNQDNTNASNSSNKFFCDGKGFLAHVNSKKQIFIKVFPDIEKANAATGEAEVEIYTSPDLPYTELENQGNYIDIAAGDSVSWTVKWFLRNLPTDINVAAGDQKLINYAASFTEWTPTQTNVQDLNAAANQIKVYPNPADNNLNITSDYFADFNIVIYNLKGQSLINKKIVGKRGKIDISLLDKGMYLYEIQLINEKIKGNFVVERN